MTDKTNESEQEMEKKNKAPEAKSDAGNTDGGVSPIAEANKAAERLERATEALTQERLKFEKLRADDILAGRSYAGQAQKEETVDEKWAREAKIRYAGTGQDPV